MRRPLLLGDLRQHFTRNGDPKRAWPDRRAAKQAASRQGKRFYQCPTCGYWHIGGGRR